MDDDGHRSQLAKLKKELEQLQQQLAEIYQESNQLGSRLCEIKDREKQIRKCQERKYSLKERLFTKRQTYLADRAAIKSLDSVVAKRKILENKYVRAYDHALTKILSTGIEDRIWHLENEIKELERTLDYKKPEVKRLTTCTIGNFNKDQEIDNQKVNETTEQQLA